VPELRHSCVARLWFGVILLGLGVLWTLDNMNLVESEPILDWWPLVLVGVGLAKLSGWGMVRRPTAGLIFVAAGLLLLAHSLGYLGWGVWQLYPMVLILIGGAIVWRSLRGPRSGRWENVRHGLASGESQSGGPPEAETFSCVAVWAGIDRKNTSAAFRGGDFTAIMGGGDVDLRAATPVPGGAVVEVFLLMGGLEIVVPENWQVVNEISAVMGGIEDARKSIQPPDGDKVLFLRGFVMMGGVEIRN
jgi:hypothetical protein